MHKPVLLNEVINYLNPKPGENFVDCTIGEAGHSLAILKHTEPDGKILGIDADSSSLARFKSRFNGRIILVNDNFRNLKQIVKKYKFYPVNGILFDLGLSSWQIEESGRGFSFKKDEPLEMNFQPEADSLTAQEIINRGPEKALREVFLKYGEERYGRRIAEQIIKERKQQFIRTTFQLRDVIENAVPYSKTRRGKIDRVLARIFQSLRIVVNDELENLKQGIEQATEILMPGGRLVVISFHSLEDRIVKIFFRPTADQPQAGRIKALTKKPIRPSEEEIRNNPRSRSAKLRAAVKL